MKTISRFHVLLAFFMTLSMVQSAFAQDATPVVPAPGNLTIVLADGNGAAVGGGCFDVIDASGAVSSFCDEDADGRIELTNVPPGEATVTQTGAPDGYSVATSVYASVLPDQTVQASVLATPVAMVDPFPVPDSTATEVVDDNSGDADPEGAATAAAESEEDSSLNLQRAGDGAIFSIVSPQIGCQPFNNEEGIQLVNLQLPTNGGQVMDPAPTATYTIEDRFGVRTGPFDAALTWNASAGQYELSDTFEGYKIAFTITNPGGNAVSLDAECALWNPIQLGIETMAKDALGEDILNGSQIGSNDTFGDTAWFEGEDAIYAPELAGLTVYYNLYKDSATCEGTPAEVFEVVIGPNGEIPATPQFDPSAEFGDGIYDWHVVFPGAVLTGDVDGSRTFAAAKSFCGSETVVVGDVEIDVATTMMTGSNQPLVNGASIPIGSEIYDTTALNGANEDVSGTVTYQLFKGVCGDAVQIGADETVTIVDGAVPASSISTPTELGDYFWVVTYSGDLNGNSAGVSGCDEETFTVEKATPAITTGMIAGGEGIGNGVEINQGTTVSDTTTIDNEYIAVDGVLGGTVTYTLLHGTCPGGSVIGTSGPTDLNADGTFPPSPDYTASLAGDYFWVVEYSGDAFNNAATSGCGDEYFKVGAIATSITTAPQVQSGENFTNIPQNGVVPGGSDVRDTAAIETSQDGSVPTGTVTYNLYSGSGCGSASVAGPFVVELNEDGTVPPSPVVPGLTPGQYNWVAVYSGDETHAGSTGACGDEQFFVGQDGEIGGFITTQVKNASNGNVADGGTVDLGAYGYDTATFYGDIVNPVDGTAAVSGTLTFNVYATPSSGATCTSPIASFVLEVTAGEAVPDSSSDMFRYENAGTYDWQAVFTPAGGGSISSICGLETVNVNKVTPTFTTTMQLNGADQANNFRFTEAGSVSDTVTTTYNQTNLVDIPAPTGILTYTLYRTTNNTCTGDAVFQSGELSVANGIWPASGNHSIAVDEHGVFNWVVTFTPDTAGAVNYNSYTSGCNQETFRKDVTPILTTEMYKSPDGTGIGELLPNGDDVNVGDSVRDTATLTGFASGATGTVTFRLHQGGTCEGTVLFENTVHVVDGVATSGTDWYRISLFGEYSWSAQYSGDINGNSNTFTTSADSDCSTETFTALELPEDDLGIETVMRDGNGATIQHGSFVDAPISVTDQAVFFNLSDQATGTVTYQLFDTATCQNPAVHTSEKTVANGMAPISDPYTIASVADNNGRIYSWEVVFQGTGAWSGITLESPCNAEQFRAYERLEYGLTTVCIYNEADNTMSTVVQLNPRTVGDTNPTMGATIVYTPLNLDLSPTSPITQTVRLEPGDSWIVNLGTEWHTSASYQSWRRVTGTVTWDQQGSGGNFRLGCNATPYDPEITTTMYSRDGEDVNLLEQGDSVPYGTKVFDTTQVTSGTSTVLMSGTLTYTLYSDATCETQVGAPTVRTLTADTPIGSLPPSADFTMNQAGTFYWVVQYSGDANNNSATSACLAEIFSISSTSPELTTAMFHSDVAGTPGDPIGNEEIIPIDSIVTDTATITGNSPDAEGTVTYELFRGGVCGEDGVLADGELLGTWDVELDGGLIPNVGEGIKIEDVGFYTWIVTYEGDSNNDAALSGCGLETFQVDPATPEIATVQHYSDSEGVVGAAFDDGSVIAIDSVVTDTATITGHSENATGTVTYQLFHGGTCEEGVFTGGTQVGPTAEVELVDGVIPAAGIGIAIENVGSYTWIVSYEGDANNAAFTVPCGIEVFTVGQAEPEIATAQFYSNEAGEQVEPLADGDIVAIDSVVTDTASITGHSQNATGTVTYQLFHGGTCEEGVLTGGTQVGPTAEVELVDGVIPAAGIGITIENVGTYTWIVSYEGDANNAAFTTPCGIEVFTVGQAEPEIATAQFYSNEAGEQVEPLADGDIVAIDSVVTDTASITGQSQNATGTVTYQLFHGGTCEEGVLTGGTQVGPTAEVELVDGVIPAAGIGITIENVGSYTWIVSYSGDANNAAFTTPCGIEVFTVGQAEPEIATAQFYSNEAGEQVEPLADGDIVAIDSVVTDTATITGQSENATGTVTYQLFQGGTCEEGVLTGGTQVGPTTEVELVDGVIPAAGIGIIIENVGTYTWIVSYEGDANNAAFTTPCGIEVFTVGQAEPEIATAQFYSNEAGEQVELLEDGSTVAIDSVVTDTATITGNSENATGIVTYQLFQGGTCGEDGVLLEGVQVGETITVDLADSTIPPAGVGITIENVGAYTWIVSYEGDANNAAFTTPCDIETFVVEQAMSDLVTEMYFAGEDGERGDVIANESTVLIDSTVMDTATIDGLSNNATGTITYTLYHGGVCADGVLADGVSIGTWTVELTDGEGEAGAVAKIIPDVVPGIKIVDAGMYTWIVVYSGDANNTEQTSGCGLETFQVEMTQPTVVTVMQYADEAGTAIENGDMLERGAVVLDTAVISGQSDTATGTVTYQLYSDALCTIPFTDPTVVDLVNGEIPNSNSVTVPDAGSYYWIVTYSGDANNAEAVSGCGEEFFHVDTVAPSVVTTMSYDNGEVIQNNDLVLTGSVVLDTAVLVGATEDASGTATYQLFSDASCSVPVTEPQEVAVTDGVIPNSAVITITEPGAYYWVVSYSGDTNNMPAVSGCGEEFFRSIAPDATVVPTSEIPATPGVTPSATADPSETVIPTSEIPTTPGATPSSTADPSATVQSVSELPSTGSGGTGNLLIGSLAGLLAAAFIASVLRLKSSER